VLARSRTQRAGFAGAAAKAATSLDCRCARRSASGQVGTKGWSFSIEQRDAAFDLSSQPHPMTDLLNLTHTTGLSGGNRTQGNLMRVKMWTSGSILPADPLHLTPRWRGVDSNFQYRGTKSVNFSTRTGRSLADFAHCRDFPWSGYNSAPEVTPLLEGM
jgi:hypothetical protein